MRRYYWPLPVAMLSASVLLWARGKSLKLYYEVELPFSIAVQMSMIAALIFTLRFWPKRGKGRPVLAFWLNGFLTAISAAVLLYAAIEGRVMR